jgi:hypothetical protein
LKKKKPTKRLGRKKKGDGESIIHAAADLISSALTLKRKINNIRKKKHGTSKGKNLPKHKKRRAKPTTAVLSAGSKKKQSKN